MITVFGGSGFIGNRLCKRLEENQDLRFQIYDKNPSAAYPHKSILGDVRGLGDMVSKINRGSTFINLAAEHRDDVMPLSLYEEVNIRGAKNICTLAQEKGVNRLVFTSTVAVYGFAPIGTNESGDISPFNEYGRTKYEAELIYREWQAKRPEERTLIIVRPTVVFGEGNRGNVYNLIRQIASGRFVMVGNGKNRKSMAYVENVAAFIEYALTFQPGVHVYNYIDKPDLNMTELVMSVRRILGKQNQVVLRLPYVVGCVIGKGFDVAARATGRKFPVSAIRIKKFCSDTVFNSTVGETGFEPPVSLAEALERTVNYEFC